MLQAGATAVRITPPLDSPLAGLFERRQAVTVADDLFVRALVLDDGVKRLALVVCDLICISSDTVRAARDQIAAKCGIPAHQVMISCTHTHTGPATVPLLGTTPDPVYLGWATDRIADTVAIACSRLVPAQIAYGTADVEGVCFNRRFRMRDGTVVFNPGIGNLDIIAPVGPIDPQVTALLVEDEIGTPLALWANLSLHYVGTDNPLAISADYYGKFAQAITDILGSQCVGLLTNGTSGDINNTDVTWLRGITSIGKQGQRVATAVAAGAIAATAMQCRDQQVVLDVVSVPFSVSRRPIMARDVEVAKALLNNLTEPGTASSLVFSFVVGQPIPKHQLPTYADEVLELARMLDERTTEVQVMCIGDFALVALPGEIFVEFGLAIKAGSPFARTAVVSLANDYIGYIPTLEAFSQGGYETWAARSAWPAPGTGERMIQETLARLQQLKTETLVDTQA